MPDNKKNTTSCEKNTKIIQWLNKALEGRQKLKVRSVTIQIPNRYEQYSNLIHEDSLLPDNPSISKDYFKNYTNLYYLHEYFFVFFVRKLITYIL